MKKCFRCGTEIQGEKEYCEPCIQFRQRIEERQRRGDLVASLLLVFGLIVVILLIIHAATYLPPRDFMIKVVGPIVFISIMCWVTYRLPSLGLPGP